MTLSLRKTHDGAITPARNKPLDAGLDFFALHEVRIEPWSQNVVDTGWELVDMPMPECGGWVSCMQIWPKSGNDAKVGLHTGAGIVDFLYAGNILILLKNQSDKEIVIPRGKAVAQAVIVPVWTGEPTISMGSRFTERGASGGILTEFKAIDET